LLALLLAVACSGEKRKVENVVTVYNEVLIDAYLRPNPKLMQNFTSTRERIKIESYMSYLLKENKIFRGDLVEMNFEDVKIKEDEAEVLTKERWLYMYIDARTRRPLSKEYDTVFSSTYYLKKIKGRWVVDRLDSEEVESESRFSERQELEQRHREMIESAEE
jgi:hypothetical protein